jgi:hypothetical protein
MTVIVRIIVPPDMIEVAAAAVAAVAVGAGLAHRITEHLQVGQSFWKEYQ